MQQENQSEQEDDRGGALFWISKNSFNFFKELRESLLSYKTDQLRKLIVEAADEFLGECMLFGGNIRHSIRKQHALKKYLKNQTGGATSPVEQQQHNDDFITTVLAFDASRGNDQAFTPRNCFVPTGTDLDVYFSDPSHISSFLTFLSGKGLRVESSRLLRGGVQAYFGQHVVRARIELIHDFLRPFASVYVDCVAPSSATSSFPPDFDVNILAAKTSMAGSRIGPNTTICVRPFGLLHGWSTGLLGDLRLISHIYKQVCESKAKILPLDAQSFAREYREMHTSGTSDGDGGSSSTEDEEGTEEKRRAPFPPPVITSLPAAYHAYLANLFGRRLQKMLHEQWRITNLRNVTWRTAPTGRIKAAVLEACGHECTTLQNITFTYPVSEGVESLQTPTVFAQCGTCRKKTIIFFAQDFFNTKRLSLLEQI